MNHPNQPDAKALCDERFQRICEELNRIVDGTKDLPEDRFTNRQALQALPLHTSHPHRLSIKKGSAPKR